MLTTSDGRHRLWVGCFGNPNGLPVICLHGGPGSGTSPLMPRFFSPEMFNVLCFDQRGCGRSESTDLFSTNTTDHLLLDLDLITAHFDVARYVLFGGSWGATLALLYAMERPRNCLGLILRGVFLNTPDNLNWLYGGGAATLYPAAWADFIAPIGDQDPTLRTVFKAYQRLLHANDEFTQLQAARAKFMGAPIINLRPQGNKQAKDLFVASSPPLRSSIIISVIVVFCLSQFFKRNMMNSTRLRCGYCMAPMITSVQ